MTSAALVRADALRIPLRDDTVDLIVTSPPYFALRSYRDGGEHFEGQIGSEPTPQGFLEALWAVTSECWRVLKPSGSLFVNLGDKRSGSGGHNNATLNRNGTGNSSLDGADRIARLAEFGRTGPDTRDLAQAQRRERARDHQGDPAARASRASRRQAPDRYIQGCFGRAKSKMLLPHRYAIGCEDGLADPEGIGWIVRQDQVWWKPNGLPEPVRDRTLDRHEYWFHLTKHGRYYGSTDPIREPHSPNTNPRRKDGGLPPKDQLGIDAGVRNAGGYFGETTFNPLGRAPSSVWSIPTEPLAVPDHLDVQHFAAFPSEWPRRLILAWSPTGICTACAAPRHPIAVTASIEDRRGRVQGRDGDSINRVPGRAPDGRNGARWSNVTAIGGYECACPVPTAPTRPAVVLDPFAGTGTVPMVARALGRFGVGIDLSADYLRLARWRVFESDHASKARERTNRDAQTSLLDAFPEAAVDVSVGEVL